MSRIKRGIHHIKRRRRLMKRVKGFEAGRKNLMKLAKTAVLKAGAHAYRDRRVKKRVRRALWQVRINAAARNLDTNYSSFMFALKKKAIKLDRKILAKLAVDYPQIFTAIAELARGKS